MHSVRSHAGTEARSLITQIQGQTFTRFPIQIPCQTNKTMPITSCTPEEILSFWFNELLPKQWWQPDRMLDQEIQSRFGSIHQAACQCELYLWRKTATGCLAEIIILDQFSRNIYRQQAQAFSADPLALCLAQNAIASGTDKMLNLTQRAFLYMPYMHSESFTIHDLAVDLFSVQGMEQHLNFEKQHQAIIKRFGRYPHRNALLGRTSTPEEIEFLRTPGSSF